LTVRNSRSRSFLPHGIHLRKYEIKFIPARGPAQQASSSGGLEYEIILA